MATAATTVTKKSRKLPLGWLIAFGVIALAVIVYIHAAPMRHDTVTENDLEYMRKTIGNYVTLHQAMPTVDQLNLPADLKTRLADRHYSLELVADHSNRGTFFQEPTFDYKQCADFLTNTTNRPGDTNPTTLGFHLHHKGKHCFIDYAALKKNAFKPEP